MSKSKARALFFCAVLIYGTIGPFVRFIDAPSEVIVLIRGAVGSLMIGVVLLLTHHPFDTERIKAKLPWVIATGLFLGLNWVFLFAAYRFTSIAVASVCNYTAPVVVVLLATKLFGEKLTTLKIACVGVALLGIVLVSGIISSDAASFNPLGIGLGLLSAACFVGIVICNRYAGEIDTYSRVLVQLATAAVVALVYVLATHHSIPLPQGPQSWLMSILLAVVHTGLAYLLWFGAQSHLPLQEVALLGYIEPVVSVILSAVVLGEPLSALGIVGAALVLGAAATSEIYGEKGAEQVG